MRTCRHLEPCVAALVAVAACQPAFEERPWLVTEPRILAVRAEPAEAAAGETVRYEAFVVDASGRVDNPPLEWATCDAPKPLAEDGAVNASCARDELPVLATSSGSAEGALPADACATFGPDPPPGGYRPRDPDPTGGYFVPVRVRGPGIATTFALERVTCALGNASFDVAKEFGDRYLANVPPRLAGLVAEVAGAPAPSRLVRGARVHLTVSWGEPERYVALDLRTQTLVERRESMRVAWYATGGAIAVEHTGRDEADPATESANEWTATDAGPMHVWAVVRDARGGVDVATYAVDVDP